MPLKRMSFDIVLPNLGFDAQSGRLIEWAKQVGDTVQKGEVIAIIESDKAEVEFESLAAGTVIELYAAEGDEVPVGAAIARLARRDDEASVQSPAPAQPPAAISQHTRELQNTPPVQPDKPLALPKVRRAARQAGIALSEVLKAGYDNPITMADLGDYRNSIIEPSAARIVELGPMQKRAAERISSSKKDARMLALQTMVNIRVAEEEIQNLFMANLVRGTTHLAIGQEACSAGVAEALVSGDTITCTYRGHGHALALGMSLRTLMAEMMGKASGACKGRGGSMHMTDKSIGLLGANAIVGAQLPIAMGAALTAQVKRSGKISVSFFGDGAANIGVFHESLNMAAVWKLPVIFVCENNLYGEYSPVRATTPIDNLADRAGGYGMPGVIVDGQDVEAVHAAANDAAQHARNGEGPSLLEPKTYRYRGHSRSDTAAYSKSRRAYMKNSARIAYGIHRSRNRRLSALP